MGAIHDGHLALVGCARQRDVTVAASIFVNPTQFSATEDLSSYPRALERDLDLLRGGGVDLVFVPAVQEVYPPGFDTWVDAGALGEKLEGAHRPGHFRGVATVVTKLFNLCRPNRAYFGRKDGQQVVVIQKMTRDLDMGVEIVVVPTVREEDGLALSSRNAHLTTEQRRAAPVVYQALCRAQELWMDGCREAETMREAVQEMLKAEPLVERIDYVSVADTESLEELDLPRTGAMVSVALVIGATRLIDNVLLD
jgi:pantoate--beta-alanine ligase